MTAKKFAQIVPSVCTMIGAVVVLETDLFAAKILTGLFACAAVLVALGPDAPRGSAS